MRVLSSWLHEMLDAPVGVDIYPGVELQLTAEGSGLE